MGAYGTHVPRRIHVSYVPRILYMLFDALVWFRDVLVKIPSHELMKHITVE